MVKKWACGHFLVKKSIDRCVHGQKKVGRKNKSGQTESLDTTALQGFCGKKKKKPIIIKKIRKIDRYVYNLKN